MLIDERQAVGVGAVALVVLAIAGVAIVGLSGVDFGDKVRFEVEFGHVGALGSGADVQIAGRRVGEVESIRLTDRGAIARVAIEERYAAWSPANSELFIASKGLVGKRYLAIGPPPDGAEPVGEIREGARLRGVDPVQIEQVVRTSIENTRRFRELLIELGPEARVLGERLSETAELLEAAERQPGAVADLVRSGQKLWASAGDTRARLAAAGLSGERLAHLAERAARVRDRLSAELDRLEVDIDAVIADLERLSGAVPDSSLDKLRVAIRSARGFRDRLDRIVARVEGIAAAIERGEGTIGALLNDPEFINDAKKLGKILKRHPWRVLGTDRPKKAPRRR